MGVEHYSNQTDIFTLLHDPHTLSWPRVKTLCYNWVMSLAFLALTVNQLAFWYSSGLYVP